MGYNAYQYETSPRKLKFEDDMPPKKSPNKPKNKAKKINKTKKVEIKSKKVQDKIKAKEAKTARDRKSVV